MVLFRIKPLNFGTFDEKKRKHKFGIDDINVY